MSDSEEPVNYPKDIFHYDPNQPAAVLAGVVYGLLTVALFAHVLRRKNWWGLCLPIGTLAFSIGFFIRFASAKSPTKLLPFLLNQVLLVVSPAAFLAFNYVVYGRLIRTFAPGQPGFSLIRPTIVAKLFVTSDVVTFIIQGTGGALQSKDNTANTGRIVLLIGIIAQAISYVVFYGLFIHSHRKFSASAKFNKTNFPWRLLHCIHFSSVCILVRSVYRSVELIEGTDGYIASHEIFFYLFDTIPLFFATAIYVIFWPGKFFNTSSSQDSVQMDSMREPMP